MDLGLSLAIFINWHVLVRLLVCFTAHISTSKNKNKTNNKSYLASILFVFLLVLIEARF